MNLSMNAKIVGILVLLVGAGTALSAQAMMPGMGGMSGSSGMPGMSSGSGMMMDMDMMNMAPMQSDGNSAELVRQLDSINSLIRQLLAAAATHGTGLSEAQTRVLGQLLENQALLLRQLSAVPAMPPGTGMTGMMGKM